MIKWDVNVDRNGESLHQLDKIRYNATNEILLHEIKSWKVSYSLIKIIDQEKKNINIRYH